MKERGREGEKKKEEESRICIRYIYPRMIT